MLATILAVAVLAIVVLVLAIRQRSITNLPQLVLSVGSPFVSLTLAVAVLTLAVLARRALLSALAVCVVAASIWVQVSWYYLTDPVAVGQHTEVRVLSSNLRWGQADAPTLVAVARDQADVITVSELTPGAVDGLISAGIEASFPHSVLTPRPGAGGIGLWSRYPLTEVSPGESRNYAMAAAHLQVPRARTETLVASVHVESPVASQRDTVAEWRIGVAALKTAMSAFALSAGGGAVVVAGDFNGTPDMRQFRDLMTNGYRDAVEQAGSGFAPTFPSRSWHPPLLTIDHVITRNAAASAVKTVYVPGSDHRALLATIQVPLDPTAS